MVSGSGPDCVYTGIDLIRAESHQFCVCLSCRPGKPDRQLHIGAVSLLRVVGAVTGIRNGCSVQNDIRALLKNSLPHGVLPCCCQKAFGKGAQLVMPRPLLHHAGSYKAAGTGYKDLFHFVLLL